MNKVLHVLVYVFLGLAGAGLFYELQLNAKRALLTDRNRLQEDCLVKIARVIEKSEPTKDTSVEIKKDMSPVEAKLVDDVDMNNILEDYDAALEQPRKDATFDWGESQRLQLRNVYVLGPDGKPTMDGDRPLMRGPGTEQELLDKLLDAAKSQLTRLNTTRAALADLRAKLAEQVEEINKLKPEARQDKVTIEEQKQQIAKIETERDKVKDELTRTKGQVDELNSEIASKTDEIQKKDEEIEAKNEEIAKAKELNESLRKMLQESIQTRGGAAAATAGTAVTSLPVGDKGKVVEVDNERMFAIVSFSEEAMKELKGEELNKPLPSLELGVKRVTATDKEGTVVGRIRLRQEVKGKTYVVCDILGDWEQMKMAEGDVVFAD